MGLGCLVVFSLCCVTFTLGIIDLEDPTTKPPIHRENLPWPSRRPQNGPSRGVKTNQKEVTKQNNNAPIEEIGTTNTGTNIKTGQIQKLSNVQKAPKLPSVLHMNKQPLCPYKATGQFPYAPDCRRFINCFKGRGMVQVCAPGTLFNPRTQECDFPSKVTCLETKSAYRVQPNYEQQHLEAIGPQGDHSNHGRVQSSENEDWKRGFKSYKVTRPPDIQPQLSNPSNGHAGIQFPSHFKQPTSTSMFQPYPQSVPNSMLQPPTSGQVLNTELPLNIPPMMFGGSPNVSNIFPVNTYGTPNPGYYIMYQQPYYSPQQPFVSPQNNPGYPIYPSYPDQNVNGASKNPQMIPQTSQRMPPSTPFNPQNSPGSYTNSPQLFAGSQPGYTQNGPAKQPVYNIQYNPQTGQFSPSRQPESFASNPELYNRQGLQNGQSLNQPAYPQYYWSSPQTKYYPTSIGSQPQSSQSVQSQYPGPQSAQQFPQNTNSQPQLPVPPNSQRGRYQPNNPQIAPQHNSGIYSNPQVGMGYQPNNFQNQPQYPNYNQNYPQDEKDPIPEYNPQRYPYDSRSPENSQTYPEGPASGHIQPGYPQSREPGIYPQGGQPGYFLVNQNSKENVPKTKTQPIHPPKYNPVDSSRHKVKCPPGATGLFPHPDCFKFLNCDHGRTFIMSCGPGTAFNPTILACDYPDNVDCLQKTPHPDTNQKEEKDVGIPDNTRQFENFTPANNATGDVPEYEDELGSPSELVEVGLIDVRGNFKEDPETTTTTTIKPKTIKTTIKPKTVRTTTIKPVSKVPPRENHGKNIKNESITHTSTQSTVQNLEKKKTTSPSSTMPIKPPKKQFSSRNEPPPISKQLVRLRGGQKANEGYLEMRGLKEWGMVCDKRGEWTIIEANIICKQLGYERGAELTWQGRPSAGSVTANRSVAFSSVWCNGNETNILDCTTKNDKTCNPEQEAVWIRCLNNPQSQCMSGEASFKGRCYNLVVPREDANIDSIGFSQGEALSHCQVRKGHLLDFTSQDESDFISEWLVSVNMTSNIMTSGVGVSVMGASIWIWEGSPDSFKYSNWWPGWDGKQNTFPSTKSNRALCVIARRYFPCPSKNKKATAETSFCDAEYFFWDVEDCAIMSNKHPYICERDADDIGCIVNNGQDYSGKASVTETSSACLPWNSTKVIAALKYRVSETSFKNTLAGHNYCRNIAGSDSKPWCFVESGDTIKKESCDIPDCKIKEDKIKTERTSEYTCGPNLFACDINDCIPSAWVCDGQPDCKNGYDELNCTGGLAQFKQHSASRLVDHDKEKWLHTSAANCATRCLEANDFVCRSFSHYAKDQICLLSESNVGLSGKLISGQPDWEYFERISHSVDCSDKFVCSNGKCISKPATCNGKNDCGDRSDERNCSAANLGYEIRLGGSNNSHEGRIEIKILGEWGYICDDQFDLRDAEVVCKELGFTLGAAEIRPHSAFLPINSTKTLFLVDDLQCRGNETSIRECDFGGWGVHDCGSEEVVGIVCKVPGLSCANNFWQCKRTSECVPVDFLCDNIPDCEDGSDEDPAHCNQPVIVRLVEGKKRHSLGTIAGRVEIRRFGVWGTICDDDFGEAEATVVCNSLGYKGTAKSLKEAAYGAGEALIWLDGVHCSGNETSLEHCLHESWGQSDCSHKEDVAVVCSHDISANADLERKSKQPILDVNNYLTSEGILPDDCGSIDEEVKYHVTDSSPKVVKGQEVIRGTIPWQASLRVRTSIKSVHWCGAVILSSLHILTSAHCLQDYTKSSYFVRVGDFDTEVPEGSEQEHDIESTYIHEDFNKEQHLNNDIALIKLKGTGLQFTSYVRAVCLPTQSSIYTTGTNCTISGWGSNGKPGAGYSRRLRATSVPIISEPDCRAPYVYGESLSPGMFCAGELQGGSDSCQGDSGGPFVCPTNGHSVLYGLTSWGHGCGRANKPGVYTKVINYISWIHDKIHESLTGR